MGNKQRKKSIEIFTTRLNSYYYISVSKISNIIECLFIFAETTPRITHLKSWKTNAWSLIEVKDSYIILR